MKRILSIDGGGIKGIIPALVLAEIEDRLKTRVASCFDLMAGTSTGGILALGLSLADSGGAPAFKARQLAELYEQRGRDIFSRSLLRKLTSPLGVMDELYGHEGLETVLQEYFGNALLGSALCKVMVTSYDITNRETIFFKSWQDKWKRVAVREAARATSAAPTYFEPLQLEVDSLQRTLVDGGIYVNNPAVSAWTEMRNEAPHEELFVLSMGTGQLERRYEYEDAKDWGKMQWIAPLINCMMDGQSDAVHYQMQRLPQTVYTRLQTKLDVGYDDMDNASKTNIEALKHKAREIIREQSGAIDFICKQLEAAG